MSVRADAETLRQIPLFRECEPVPLQVMAFAAERQEFSAGEEILSQGKKARAAFFVLNGSVDLRRENHSVGRAEPGSLLGEVAMIGGNPSTLTAKALDRVSTARISHDLFLRVAQEYPEFGRAVLNNLSDKLVSSVRDFEQVRVLLNKARKFSDL
ncbi:MAG: cyclic nucleotide-binding domain-containing protein [Alphaproteobacteria bacterium]|nr:cyclic nucleotide-binding domain-containing protein [Alphaproteobacteria bacterium]